MHKTSIGHYFIAYCNQVPSSKLQSTYWS